MIRIAVDAMSGDLGPRTAISAVLQLAAETPDVSFILVGARDSLEPLLSSDSLPATVTLHHAPARVAMTDDPRAALRRGRESSMWQALDLVRTGRAQACVSAGNTGALMAMGRYLLKALPGIQRPAICKSMPVATGCTYMLDLGANVQASPRQLHQFALMGSALASSVLDRPARVGLLNVGVEAGKGPDWVRAANDLLLQDTRLDYLGYVEGDEIYTGRADVVVTDGFTGNVALKASEGVARLIGRKIESGMRARWWYRLFLLPLTPLIRHWRSELSPGAYNGATLLGLRQPVIKSHGGADAAAFRQALQVAIDQVRCEVIDRIAAQLRLGGHE
ncbi:phosphate acyltransferase PlsX [Marinimicrobium sp. C2-29]|uniref:phosphate acyltransferase PlsX n=1 Tax=Marinimicrobium sp. C2-29 TaxID=3139825 RepID=UPI003139869A